MEKWINERGKIMNEKQVQAMEENWNRMMAKQFERNIFHGIMTKMPHHCDWFSFEILIQLMKNYII